MRIRRKKEGGRKRFSPLLWIASLVAAALLALGVTGTLAQGEASITNSQNNVETPTPVTPSVQLSEALLTPTGPGDTLEPVGPGAQNPCGAVADPANSPVTCADINKYGAAGDPATPMSSGETRTTSVRLTNLAAESERNFRSGNLFIMFGACTTNATVCAGVQVAVSCTFDNGSARVLSPRAYWFERVARPGGC